MYEDRVRHDVKYLLQKLGDKFLCMVAVGDDVVTAYLINQAKYLKYSEKVGLKTLLELDLKRLIDSLERKCGITLPREVTEVYLDRDHNLLFIRFSEPDEQEVGEPLCTRTLVTLFTEEKTGKITALEMIGISDLLEELSNESSE
ncbi:MAG: hypothetical protein DSO07_03865 [Thermoproteota archaeon]|uniref:Uncharacterized protein n=2 Tax=Candidatus Methanodesulfokora washburnensis TaxID=2478471 RepID=A0A3R9PHX5_9CREN|nr:hypothetical protein D6D85_03295 [Candidatus Methanodesulfokores washburnensis]TDA41572.1 MAG: hypothetical protein DSO07_03865 [Candidatus Korarchaeota archaeon]